MINKNLTILLTLIIFTSSLFAQSAWLKTANNINPDQYFGVTVANGIIGVVSSPEPMKVKDVVLNGTYDYYQRGRVSNILDITPSGIQQVKSSIPQNWKKLIITGVGKEEQTYSVDF